MIEADGTILPEPVMSFSLSHEQGGAILVMRREVVTLDADGNHKSTYRPIEGFSMPLILAENLCQQLAGALGLVVSKPERN